MSAGASAFYAGNLWLIGGYTGEVDGVTFRSTASVLIYDPETDTWETAPPLPFWYRHRRLPCAAHKRRIRLARVLDNRLIHGCPCPLPRVALDPIVVDRHDLIQRKKRERRKAREQKKQSNVFTRWWKRNMEYEEVPLSMPAAKLAA